MAMVIEPAAGPAERPVEVDPRALARELTGAVRGEEHRKQIALSISRSFVDEHTFEASPYGFVERVKEKLTPGTGNGDSA